MNKRFRRLIFYFVALLLSAASSCRSPVPGGGGWTDTLWMGNEFWQVGVSASAGRILHLSAPGGPNLLRVNKETAGNVVPPAGRWDWLDHGGDWLWPMAQEDWRILCGEIPWPPPPVFEYKPWTLSRGGHEGPWIEMELRVGEPLHILVRRRIHLPDAHSGELRIAQSIERVAPSDIPVCLWQVAQVHTGEAVRMERRADSALPRGFHMIQGNLPPSHALHIGADQIVFTCGVVPAKIGTDGNRISGQGLHITLNNPDGGLGLPDGGCALALAHHPDKPYVEIETMSPRALLRPGERLDNLLIYVHSPETR